MKKNFLVLSVFCVAALFYTGCSKKQTLEVDNETQSVVDNAIADQEFMVLAPTVQQHAFNSRSVAFKTLVNCDTLHQVSGDTLFGKPGHVDPVYTMTVAGCSNTLPDGKTRTGMLRVRFTGRLRTAGTKMIIKMQDYKADDIVYSCDSMIVTTVAASLVSTEFNIKLINGVCTGPGYTIRYSCDRTVTNSFSSTSPYISVYGTASGINRSGRAFTVNIPKTSPLTKHANCMYIDKGILELTPDGFKTRTVDFGDGACDDAATFSVNGNTLAFKLK